jgi:hypothetical protein
MVRRLGPRPSRFGRRSATLDGVVQLVVVPPPARERKLGMRERRHERRRLAEQDRRAAHQADLYVLRGLLADASQLVAAGWVQHCWFTVPDENGGRKRIGPRNLHELGCQPAAEVCLVGAIVEAGGGIAKAGTQPVRHAIDLTWATLYNDAVRWYPPPLRLAHIHDLTRWNDSARRTPDDVADLLTAASCRAVP